MNITSVIEEVLQRIRPGEEERAFVRRLMDELEEIAIETAERLGINAKPRFVGSLAKDTYLAGDHDVDLFLAFPLDTPLEALREKGLELGKAIAERLDSYEVAYAEHPYVRARYRGVKVDLVPCYDVKSWRDVRTAVDRSILHNRWVLDNLGGRNDDVRLLKRFFKGIGVYGSEIYVRGFSGYLTELLVIYAGSFAGVLEKHEMILRMKVLDPAGWLRREPELSMKTVERESEAGVPLIVIDPADPRRNVAANLSWEKFGKFYFKAGDFLKKPDVGFFFPPEKPSGSYSAELRKKGTHLLTLLFEKPELIDDILLPQLERSAKGLAKALQKEHFRVFGMDYGYSGERAFVMLELDRLEREKVTVKPGPELHTIRARDFYRKNERVWMEGKRLYAEKRIRENLVDVVSDLLDRNQVALGKNVREGIKRAEILLDFVPQWLERDAYLFLSREKWNLKG